MENLKKILIEKEKRFYKDNKEIYEAFLKDRDTRGIKELEEILKLYEEYKKER